MARCIARILLLSVICFLATVTLGAEKPKPKEIAGRLHKVYEEDGKRFLVLDLYKYYGKEAEKECLKSHPAGYFFADGPPEFYDPPGDTATTTFEISGNAKFIGLRVPPNSNVIEDSSLTFDELPYVAQLKPSPKQLRWLWADVWWITLRDSVVIRARAHYSP